MKLINKDALVSEINRIIDVLEKNSGYTGIWGDAQMAVCEKILSSLDTVEVKEVDSIWNDARKTIPEDSSNQIVCIKEDGLAVSTVGKIVNGTIKWAYLNDLLNISDVQVKEVDLDNELDFVKDAYYYFTSDERSSMKKVARHFFELGLKAQNNITVSNIDDVIRENGLDPDSKEVKVFKESYCVAIDKAFENFKKGE